jgi:hypothetical protein
MSPGEFDKILNEFVRDKDTVIPQKIAKIIAPKIAKKIENIFNKRINEFYEAYSPEYYRRTGSLHNAYKVSYTAKSVIWNSTSDMVQKTHRVDSVDGDYIYKLTIMDGYHGGGYYNGIPTYRMPVPAYVMWGRPAARSAAPAPLIESDIAAFWGSEEFDNMKNTAAYSVFKQYRLFNR